MSNLPPIRREVVVAASPAVAFRVFTERIGVWWPLAEHSVFGAGGSVSFAADRIVEVAPDGRTSVWGTVTEWRPGRALRFTWHPGRTADRAGQVKVTFTAAGDATLVTLTHDGWEAYADPLAAREEYDHGWPTVLGSYGDDVPRAA